MQPAICNLGVSRQQRAPCVLACRQLQQQHCALGGLLPRSSCPPTQAGVPLPLPGTTPAGRARLWHATQATLQQPGWGVCKHKGWGRPAQQARVVLCQGTGDSEGPKRGGPDSSGNGAWNPIRWLFQQQSKLQIPMRIVFNLVCIYLLMRVWPMSGGGAMGRQDNIVVQLPFSEFVRSAKANEVHSVVIDGAQINFSLRTSSALLAARPDQAVDPSKVTFYTVRPLDYSLPYNVLEQNNVMFTAADKGNRAVTLMAYSMFVVLLLAALSRVPLKMSSPRGPGRRHKSGGDNGERPVVTFADVAGVDEAKEELAEIVDYLRAPERFSKLGARPPSGVLLAGPPGTGKTLLAKAVAGEAEVPFFSISASEFVELYVGMGAMRVRELFAAARKEAPAIVFIDEIDAVAKGRDMRLRSVGNDEREQTLNQLLTELDGFDSDKATVICIAATNRPDVLDPALLRPGRFDRRVTVERPDKTGREQILKVHLERKALPLSTDVSVSSLASGTTGFTGADLANLVNEAALLAGRRSKNEVGREEFDAAILRAVAGIEKKRSILVGLEKEVVARHEVGHALVASAMARILPHASAAVEKLSIIPRTGGALGFTYIPPKSEDRALMFDSEIRGQLAMLMGGRAAEQLTCGSVSTGAVDDIRRATDLAHKAVAEFGLSAAVGPLNVSVLAAGGSDDGGLGLFAGQGNTGRVVEAEVKRLVEGALACALEVVRGNASVHDGLSQLLVSKERLEGPELHSWLQHVKVPQALEEFVREGKLPDRALLSLPMPAAPAAGQQAAVPATVQ